MQGLRLLSKTDQLNFHVHTWTSLPIFMSAAISLDYESIVEEVSEDAGTVEVFRVIKRGLTEQPLQVFFSGGIATLYVSQCVLHVGHNLPLFIIKHDLLV